MSRLEAGRLEVSPFKEYYLKNLPLLPKQVLPRVTRERNQPRRGHQNSRDSRHPSPYNSCWILTPLDKSRARRGRFPPIPPRPLRGEMLAAHECTT